MNDDCAKRCSAAANEYDRSAEQKNWRGPEVVFGLAYAFVEPGQSLLDIGIGTGLSAALFHKAGLAVHGMDLSPQMLEACRAKGFTADLTQHDLTVAPYPYDTASMDHAVSVGVLNHFGDLRTVFSEVSRIVRPGGIFGFVVEHREAGQEGSYDICPPNAPAGTTHTMYRHGADDISELLANNSFTMLRSLEFPVMHGGGQPLRAMAYIVRRG